MSGREKPYVGAVVLVLLILAVWGIAGTVAYLCGKDINADVYTSYMTLSIFSVFLLSIVYVLYAQYRKVREGG